MQELEADARVVAHADRDLAHVGVDRLAEVRDRVDERDLGREERVRRVLDHLGRRGVGDEHRRVRPTVELGDAHRRLAVLAADHDAVGVQEVADRLALAQELGVRRDGHALEQRARLGQDPLHEARRADRHRRLVDDDRAAAQHRGDLAGDALDVTRSAEPSAPCGVCTHRNTISALRAAAAAPTTNDSRCDARPSLISSGEPVLEDRHLALFQAATRSASMSAQRTS